MAANRKDKGKESHRKVATIDIPITYARGRGATRGVHRGRGVGRGRGRICGGGNPLGPDGLSCTGESPICRKRGSSYGVGRNYSRPGNKRKHID